MKPASTIANDDAAAGGGLYVHCPFCLGKCLYCDFYSLASPARLPQWLEGLKREIDFWRPQWPFSFNSLYLGGGTPSLMSAGQLAGLLERLFNSFHFLPGPEVSLEANPEDVHPEILQTCRRAGVTRLSLGVQSFAPDTLKFMGRRHGAEQAFRAAELILAAGFKLNIDLIFALPGQTVSAWQAELDQALRLAPPHLSLYGLTAEPGTPLAARLAKGLYPPLPDEARFAELFLFTGEYLAARGYQRYEVSNFASGPGEQSRHNLKYWRHQTYLGLGPAAHSFKNNRRYANPRSLNQWLANLAARRPPYLERETLTQAELKTERIMLGLRLAEGLEEELLQGSGRLASLLEHGYLYRDKNRLKPTEAGFLAADRLSLELA